MTQTYLWTVEGANSILGNLYQKASPDFQAYTENFSNLSDSDQLFVQYANALAPEPLNLAHVFKRVPYTNPAVLRKRLAESVKHGWLTQVGDGAYGISANGRKYVNGLIQLAEECYASLTQVDETDLTVMINLLDRIDDEIESYAEVGEKHAWQIAHRLENPNLNPLVQARRRLIYLLSYRDDAHVAAWSSLAIEGYTWEAFSYIWNGQVNSATQLAEALHFRNYDVEAYQGALDDLVGRSWLAVAGDTYGMTSEGQRVRDEAEKCTNYYFNSVFNNIPKAELVKLKKLMKQLAISLKPSPVIA